MNRTISELKVQMAQAKADIVRCKANYESALRLGRGDLAEFWVVRGIERQYEVKGCKAAIKAAKALCGCGYPRGRKSKECPYCGSGPRIKGH